MTEPLWQSPWEVIERLSSAYVFQNGTALFAQFWIELIGENC